jgi:hypothetical protein
MTHFWEGMGFAVKGQHVDGLNMQMAPRRLAPAAQAEAFALTQRI